VTTLTAPAVRRRYLLLTALRWLPTGLLIPVVVLLPLERGLTLAQYGATVAAQGIVVLLLELPTGGLADVTGRRPVLLASCVVGLISVTMLAVAHAPATFLLVYALQGVYRALDSGPLEAWYVDGSLAADPAADIETGLSRGSAALSLAVAGGALASGALVALGPRLGVSALTVPVLAAVVVQAVSLAAVAAFMPERRTAAGGGRLGRLRTSVRGVPAAVGGALRLAGRSRVLLALIAVELFWGFGMIAFESLTPVRLAEVVGSRDAAGALLGPTDAAAWAVSAVGAALVPLAARRLGAPWTGFWLRIAHGVTVLGMALAAGAAGVIAGYLLCYTVHGAANPVHSGLLHRQVGAAYRNSVVSLNSMVGQPAGAVGLVALTGLAQGVSTSVAMLAGAVVLAAAAPLYLTAARRTARQRSSQRPRWSFATPARRV
jgi:MFS transporter, DHA1 family, tetracycline resistance protein